MKVYVSKGRQTPEIKKMVQQVSNALSERIEKGEDTSDFRVATTPEELKSLYKKYCISDAEVISETTNGEEVETKNDFSGKKDEDDAPESKQEPEEASGGANEFYDPFTEKNVLERDYTKATTTQSEGVIAEPTNMEDSFQLPDDDGDDNGGNNGGGKSEPKKEKQAFNENLKDLDEGQKRKAFKRTAKAIVMAYKQFSGKPFEYLATKDINEAKLTEYHTTGELDADLMLELPDDVMMTVRQFFAQNCLQVDGMFKLDPEIEHEIEEALTDVLMEKQIALTPMQRLGFYVAQDLGGKLIALVQFKSSINATLDYLKTNHAEKKEAEKAEQNTPRAEVKTTKTESSKEVELVATEEA